MPAPTDVLCLEVAIEALNDVSATVLRGLGEVGALEVVDLDLKLRLFMGGEE